MCCSGRFSTPRSSLIGTIVPPPDGEISPLRDMTPMVKKELPAQGLRSGGSTMLTHAYDYGSILETSQRINWQIADVIAGREFDFSRPFLPEALAGVAGLRCLDDEEKLKVNHIRAFTYLYLFGLVEEYILPSVLDHVRG